nr:protein PIN-LIKES 4 isoform X2 [Arachis hypogaea]
MQFWKLFITALMPVLKVLLITALGAFLALDRFNVLRDTARKHLNTLVYYVFTPALVCSILTKTITFKNLVMLWFMPLNILLTFIVGTALGWLFMKITKAPNHMYGLVLGCCAAGNLGNLPLIIMPTVCKGSNSPFGAVDLCYKKGMGYASLSMALPKLAKIVKTLVEKLNLKVLLAPATVGSIVGLVMGGITPFRKLFVGDDAPLRVLEDSTSMVGDAAIPAVTLLVGANLLKGLKGSGMKVPLLLGILVVRYIALPMLGVCIVKGAIHFGLINHDPLYQFMLLLQYALPPAISISTITQLFGAGETECSIIMLATYACAAVSLTLWSTFFMWLVL